MTGMAQTVLGPIPINQLGITLMHEHLLLDLECYFDEPEAASEKKFIDEFKSGMNKMTISKNLITILLGIAASIVGFIILIEIFDVLFGIKLIQ